MIKNCIDEQVRRGENDLWGYKSGFGWSCEGRWQKPRATLTG